MNHRPVIIDLNPFHLFLPGLISILHRISGVIIFFLIPLMLWLLQKSLQSEQAFEELRTTFNHIWFQVVLGIAAIAFLFHLLAGIRHMLMDIHIADTKKGGRIGASVVIIVFFVVVVICIGWILFGF